MAPPEQVNRVIDHIVKQFRPERIVLFGSYASGTASEGSDVDLLVIMPTAIPPIRQAVAVYRSLDHDIPVDILVRTPAQVEARNPLALIIRTVLGEGITVHGAGVRMSHSYLPSPPSPSPRRDFRLNNEYVAGSQREVRTTLGKETDGGHDDASTVRE
ncbi:MAG: nucleotidyltransferase domain-containing protein [Thermomicrobiales bacterium]